MQATDLVSLLVASNMAAFLLGQEVRAMPQREPMDSMSIRALSWRVVQRMGMQNC